MKEHLHVQLNRINFELILCATLIGVSEGIKVLWDIEENTRVG